MTEFNDNCITNIAGLAGVGTDVVRKVLSGSSGIDERVKDRILKIIHDKNYLGIQDMRNRKRGNYNHTTVGIILPDVTHNFWFEVIKGINDRLVKEKYNISIFNLARNEGEFYEYMIDERFAGIIIIGRKLPARVIEMMNLTNTRFTFVDICVDGCSSVYIDNKLGGQLAAKHLIEKKSASIAYIGHNEQHVIQSDRLEGFKTELLNNGINEVIEEYVPLDNNEAYKATLKFINEKKADGIFYFCDTLAYLGLTALKELSVNIPIVGYDDMPMSELIGLTTIRQPAYEMGQAGASELIRLISSVDNKRAFKCITPEIIKRDT